MLMDNLEQINTCKIIAKEKVTRLAQIKQKNWSASWQELYQGFHPAEVEK